MVRTAKALSLMLMVVLVCSLWSPVCQAWSVWPFGDSKAEQPKPKPPVAKPAKKAPPSTWDTLTAGTKHLCNKVGETVGLKKPAPKKPDFAVPRPMVPQKAPPKSWLGSLFKPKDPPPPKDVAVFIGQKRPTVP
jgi:hypothetical protein